MSHPVSPICQKLILFFSVFSGVLEAPRGRQVGRHTQMHLCGRVAPQVCFYSMGHYPNTALFNPPPKCFFPMHLCGRVAPQVCFLRKCDYSLPRPILPTCHASHSSYTPHRHLFGGGHLFLSLTRNSSHMAHSHSPYTHITGIPSFSFCSTGT